MRTVVAYKTDVGRVREGNEDSLLVQDPLYAIADGMGGHVAGDVASQTAIETITRNAEGAVEPGALADLIKQANVAIWEKAQEEPALRGMGTTCTLISVDGSQIHIGHVGDSRAYMLRDGKLLQLTEDHTLVGRMVKEGRLQPEEAERHPQRNIITRTLGVDPEVQVDTMSLEMVEGDRILICSDGLNSMLDAGEIRDALADETDPQVSVDRLVEEANAAGGEDNVTVVVIDFEAGEGSSGAAATEIEEESPEMPPPPPRVDTLPEAPRAKSRVTRAILSSLLIVAVLAVGGFMIFRYAIVENSYFVGVNGSGMVTIYQGLPDEVAGVTFKEEQETSSVALADLPEFLRGDVEDGIDAESLDDARETVANLKDRARDEEFEVQKKKGGNT